MTFTEILVQLGKINTFSSKCRIVPRLPLFAIKQSGRSSHSSTGSQCNSTTVPKIGRNSFGVFDFKQQIRNVNRNACSTQRWYSEKGSNKSDQKRDEKDDDGDDDSEKPSKRTVPSLGEDVIVWPNFFRTLKNSWVILYMRFNVDRQFNLMEFVVGTRQALQVISHKLSVGDFEDLKQFVDPNEVERVQAIVEKMTVAQRSELAIVKDDIYFAFPYDVVITEKVDSESQRKRVFAEILMVFHVMRGLQRLKESNVEIPMNIGTSPEFAKDLWIANYQFRKEFTDGADDEWTVSRIQQIKSIDELEE